MKTETEIRKHQVCFTGHRPEKLNLPEQMVKRGLEKAIKEAVGQGYTTFITGMARGVDIWAAQIVLRGKTKNPAIQLICAVPHPGFEEKWNEEWRSRYNYILEHADQVETISDQYTGPGVYMVRNKWMVDHSSLVIAVFNGQKSGTKNTVDYADSQGIRVINIL